MDMYGQDCCLLKNSKVYVKVVPPSPDGKVSEEIRVMYGKKATTILAPPPRPPQQVKSSVPPDSMISNLPLMVGVVTFAVGAYLAFR